MAKKSSTVREYLEALLIALILLGFTNTFLVKTFYIPSASMEDSLLIGDPLFVNRFIYGQPPAGQADENSGRLDAVDTVRYLLIVCLGIAAGFFAVQFVYVAAIDNSTSVNTAKVVSFVAFLVASGVVIKLLTKYFIPGLSRGLR